MRLPPNDSSPRLAASEASPEGLDASLRQALVSASEEGIEEVYPVSLAQRDMLFTSVAFPAADRSVTQLCFALSELPDPAILERAWRLVFERHPMLRTAFHTETREPLQVVHRRASVPWSQLDWRELPAPTAEERLASFLAGDRARGFDLSTPPLVRLTLLRRAAGRDELVWTFYGALLDGPSVALLLRELATLYGALRRGEEVSLGPVRSFREFVAWQRGRESASAEVFWRRELAGFTAPTPLVDGRTADPGEEVRAVAVARSDIGFGRNLPEWASTRRLSPATVWQGAWAVLLSRYAGVFEVVFGHVTSERSIPIPGIREIVGPVIDLSPRRVEIPGEVLLGEWLETLETRCREAREYGHHSLRELQGWSEVRAPLPLFESLVAYGVSAPGATPAGSSEEGHRAELLSAHQRLNVPLALVIEPAADTSPRILYDPHRFEATVIARVLGHLGALVEGIEAAAGRPLAALSLLRPVERHQLLVESNDTAREYPLERSLDAFIFEQIERMPDAVAVVFEERNATFRQLGRQADHLAAVLVEHGVGPEVLVGVFMERSLELVVALTGILRAGAAYLPLDPSHPEKRLEFLLADAAPAVVLTQKDLRDRLPRADSTVLEVEPEKAPAEARVATAVRPENLAYCIYTSGSTGRPKGALLSHRGIVNRLLWMQRAYGLGLGDTVLQKTPFTFDVSVWEFFWPLMVGARLVVMRPGRHRDSATVLRRIAAERVSTLHFVPSMLRTFLGEPGIEGLYSLRRVIVSGEALSHEVQQRFARRSRAALENLYGPTEASVDVTYWPCRPMADQRVPIGRPIDNIRVFVLDPRQRVVPPGAVGELHLAGAGLARGYLGRLGLTAERFVPARWGPAGGRLYRTGDRVRLRPDGVIDYLGRIDHQVKIRGLRIEPGEVEAVLEEHPEVRSVLVMVRPELPGGPGLVAYVVGSPETAALRRFARERLPEYSVPQAFVELPELPLNPNGKVDRRALPAPGRRLEDGASSRPSGRLEEEVAAIWCQILGVPEVGRRDKLEDLGGHSWLLLEIRRRLLERLSCDVSLADLLRHRTVEALAGLLATRVDEVTVEGSSTGVARESPIAVIGMAGRFPGARNLDEFWRNLKAGVASISIYGEDELRAAGVAEDMLGDPRYVRAHGGLEDIELFDAEFFGFNLREAEVTDPQHRLFLECAWEGLENAGYDAERFPGRIGVFAGASASSYWRNLLSREEVMQSVGPRLVSMGNDKDYLATRTSYKMNLTGPSTGVQTACSTSLVAVHLACQSLRRGESDMALAGGVSVQAQISGYLYEPGGILAPDGRCRAFDARARGTVPGDGVGVVVLKRLSDAVAAGDTIRGVLLGTAINNDGSRKAGFTAPSVEGQAAALRSALALGEVDPGSVSYVEAHGTGTELGDPIEVQALREAYAAQDAPPVALGSVKTNIGHLDAAAGVAGLLKTLLALEHEAIPPSLHFEEANPQLALGDRFVVNAALTPWPRGEALRRAGVSSFGIGGTNSHAVLEEAPLAPVAPSAREQHLLLLSARTVTALEATSRNLAAHLAAHPKDELADVAYTLAVGRRIFAHRRALVCGSREEAREKLGGGRGSFTGQVESAISGAVFLFPGEGARIPGMGADLYATEAVFRNEVDSCAELLKAHLGGEDVRRWMFDRPATVRAESGIDQPALFVFALALARWWMALGVRPRAMLGHGLGECVAACLVGVWSLAEALELVAIRGRLMATLAAGSPPNAVEDLYRQALSRLRPDRPRVLCISSLTGRSLGEREAMDPEHWLRQLRQPGAPDAGVEEVLKRGTVFLEMGPGSALGDAVRGHEGFGEGQTVIPSLSEAAEGNSLLAASGRAWVAGLEIRFAALWSGENRRRVPLPTYPFERRKFWIEGRPDNLRPAARTGLRKRTDLAEWFYLPFWKPAAPAVGDLGDGAHWLLFAEDSGFSEVLARTLKEAGQRVTSVRAGESFHWREDGSCTLAPQNLEDYARLVESLEAWGGLPDRMVHLWSIGAPEDPRWTEPDAGQVFGFASLLRWVQALVAHRPDAAMSIAVVGDAMQAVHGRDLPCPAKAPLVGLTRVIPQELRYLTCQVIDVDPEAFATATEHGPLAGRLLAEMTAPRREPSVALRGRRRFLRDFRPVRLDASMATAPRARGVYLVTGGLGHLGLTFAGHLARGEAVRLVLLGRTPLPDRDRWDELAASQVGVGVTIRRLRALEEAGAEVTIERADVADRLQMAEVLRLVRKRFGAIHGVVHAAGRVGGTAFRPLEECTLEQVTEQFRAKVEGAQVLAELLRDVDLDFCVLCSSLASVLGGLGFAAYAAANRFMDSLAHVERVRHGKPWISIDWDGWRSPTTTAAEAQEAVIEPPEGAEAFARILALAGREPRVVVSTSPLEARIDRWLRLENAVRDGDGEAVRHPRPALLRMAFVAPESALEKDLAGIWQDLLGIDAVGLDDDFLELGGDSLLATQVITVLRQRLQVELSLQVVFEASTVRRLAVVVEESRSRCEEFQTASDLLAEVERLTEEEMDRLLLENTTERVSEDSP